MTMASQFFDMTSSSTFSAVVLFFLSSLVTCPSFMSILSLVVDLWQFPFIRDWPEIRKSEIPTFCPCKLWIPNLAQMPLIKCYWMLKMPGLQLLPFELLRENQQGGIKPQTCNFLKKETLAQLFSCEFLRTHFHTDNVWWLLLKVSIR